MMRDDNAMDDLRTTIDKAVMVLGSPLPHEKANH